ncbi:HTH domain-containing protein [Helicobacter sp. 23-1045]
MTFLSLAKEVLSKAEIPLNYSEIWDSAKTMGLDKQIRSEGKTPQHTLRVALTNDIKNHADSPFCIVSKHPMTFWLDSRKDEIVDKESEIEQKRQESYAKELQSKEKGFLEIDLHPLLVKFASENFGLYCKTINANTSKSTQKGLNEWIHPDIVGIYFPFDDYESATFDLLGKFSKADYKLYSFELKRVINNANLKECYFQVVSNSSWANWGYLVAYQIDESAQGELERLNASFGIGVIELQSEKIMFEARERELDSRTLNMLVAKNTDFRKFIENINKDIETYLASGDTARIARDKYD